MGLIMIGGIGDRRLVKWYYYKGLVDLYSSRRVRLREYLGFCLSMLVRNVGS